MRTGITLAILIGTTCTALAGSGFDIVIPGRPGVPIIINGVDASYAVIEGEWGLGKGVHMQPTIFGGRYVDPKPRVGHYYPSAGHVPGLRAGRNRSAGESQPAAARGELSSILVLGIRRAAGGDRRTLVPAAGDRRAKRKGRIRDDFAVKPSHLLGRAGKTIDQTLFRFWQTFLQKSFCELGLKFSDP